MHRRLHPRTATGRLHPRTATWRLHPRTKTRNCTQRTPTPKTAPRERHPEEQWKKQPETRTEIAKPKPEELTALQATLHPFTSLPNATFKHPQSKEKHATNKIGCVLRRNEESCIDLYIDRRLQPLKIGWYRIYHVRWKLRLRRITRRRTSTNLYDPTPFIDSKRAKELEFLCVCESLVQLAHGCSEVSVQKYRFCPVLTRGEGLFSFTAAMPENASALDERGDLWWRRTEYVFHRLTLSLQQPWYSSDHTDTFIWCLVTM